MPTVASISPLPQPILLSSRRRSLSSSFFPRRGLSAGSPPGFRSPRFVASSAPSFDDLHARARFRPDRSKVGFSSPSYYSSSAVFLVQFCIVPVRRQLCAKTVTTGALRVSFECKFRAIVLMGLSLSTRLSGERTVIGGSLWQIVWVIPVWYPPCPVRSVDSDLLWQEKRKPDSGG
ncbi:hypothetical protein Taro_054744 [Colocasia esculenta]|uniref:ASD1 domain-containing protein n=1 Tax=Colocasia esculenta TaxID=4460 RepID=A0A843XPP7_COLES|nr:hypothetical protein [Colocasia esculenta]